MATVRYIVKDVEASIVFYTTVLDFELIEQWGPPFAKVGRGDLTLWLSGPESSAQRAMPDGRKPESGGWNRLVIEVIDIKSVVDKLHDQGATFRSDLVTGPGGTQIVVDDPSGNPLELFQAK